MARIQRQRSKRTGAVRYLYVPDDGGDPVPVDKVTKRIPNSDRMGAVFFDQDTGKALHKVKAPVVPFRKLQTGQDGSRYWVQRQFDWDDWTQDSALPHIGDTGADTEYARETRDQSFVKRALTAAGRDTEIMGRGLVGLGNTAIDAAVRLPAQMAGRAMSGLLPPGTPGRDQLASLPGDVNETLLEPLQRFHAGNEARRDELKADRADNVLGGGANLVGGMAPYVATGVSVPAIGKGVHSLGQGAANVLNKMGVLPKQSVLPKQGSYSMRPQFWRDMASMGVLGAVEGIADDAQTPGEVRLLSGISAGGGGLGMMLGKPLSATPQAPGRQVQFPVGPNNPPADPIPGRFDKLSKAAQWGGDYVKDNLIKGVDAVVPSAFRYNRDRGTWPAAVDWARSLIRPLDDRTRPEVPSALRARRQEEPGWVTPSDRTASWGTLDNQGPPRSAPWVDNFGRTGTQSAELPETPVEVPSIHHKTSDPTLSDVLRDPPRAELLKDPAPTPFDTPPITANRDQAAVDFAASRGIPMTPGERTGQESIRAQEWNMKTEPGRAGAWDRLRVQQNEGIKDALMRELAHGTGVEYSHGMTLEDIYPAPGSSSTSAASAKLDNELAALEGARLDAANRLDKWKHHEDIYVYDKPFELNTVTGKSSTLRDDPANIDAGYENYDPFIFGIRKMPDDGVETYNAPKNRKDGGPSIVQSPRNRPVKVEMEGQYSGAHLRTQPLPGRRPRARHAGSDRARNLAMQRAMDQQRERDMLDADAIRDWRASFDGEPSAKDMEDWDNAMYRDELAQDTMAERKRSLGGRHPSIRKVPEIEPFSHNLAPLPGDATPKQVRAREREIKRLEREHVKEHKARVREVKQYNKDLTKEKLELSKRKGRHHLLLDRLDKRVRAKKNAIQQKTDESKSLNKAVQDSLADIDGRVDPERLAILAEQGKLPAGLFRGLSDPHKGNINRLVDFQRLVQSDPMSTGPNPQGGDAGLNIRSNPRPSTGRPGLIKSTLANLRVQDVPGRTGLLNMQQNMGPWDIGNLSRAFSMSDGQLSNALNEALFQGDYSTVEGQERNLLDTIVERGARYWGSP